MMKTTTMLCSFLMVLLAFVPVVFGEDTGWPRSLEKDGNTMVIYQPQVDEWKDFSALDWRMAFTLTPENEKPVVGVVVLKGTTDVDNDQGMVLISDIGVEATHFPSLDKDKAARMDKLVRSFVPPNVSISLHRLVACVPKKEKVQGVALKNDPPRILVSEKPAILLNVDGDPVLAPIKDTALEYVVNTHWPLFYDKQNAVYYLSVGDRWLAAATVQGPWAESRVLGQEMNKLPDESPWTAVRKMIPPPADPKDPVPAVFFSNVPAEMLLFEGKPVYEEIPGTSLKYATNTSNYLFLDTGHRKYYFLTSGRWFGAEDLNGPWTFASADLPADFKNIPRTHPAAQVLVSVPGTEEAEDAVLMARIPTTATIDPKAAAAAAKVTYDGEPKFAPIEGTTLSYATNTPQKVIRVGDLYYLCLQGIWFVSASPQGPWQTASSVPQVIYTIPPSSPAYNATYVKQTTSADGTVVVSYTSGYNGVYVTDSSTVVIGTGYYYPPYVAVYPAYPYYPVYYPPPYTYGYNSWYNTATGAYGVSQTAYGEYGSATRAAAYNPYTGTYARGASVTSDYGSAAAARAYNPYTGASAATRQASNAYASWGGSVVSRGGESAYSRHYSTAEGSVGAVQTSAGGRLYGASTQYGDTAVGKTASGDLYAGHDGNVYRNTGDGWEKYDNGDWSSAQSNAQQQAQQRAQNAPQQAPQRASSFEDQRGEGAGSIQQRSSSFSGSSGDSDFSRQFQQEAQNRQRGEQSSNRFQGFQESRGSRSFGGGGFGGFNRGGGRFGGRR